MGWFLKRCKAIRSWITWVLTPEELPKSGSPKKTDKKSFLKEIFSSEELPHTHKAGMRQKKSFLNNLFTKEQLAKADSQNTPCKKTGFIRYIFSSEDLGKDRPTRNAGGKSGS